MELLPSPLETLCPFSSKGDPMVGQLFPSLEEHVAKDQVCYREDYISQGLPEGKGDIAWALCPILQTVLSTP